MKSPDPHAPVSRPPAQPPARPPGLSPCRALGRALVCSLILAALPLGVARAGLGLGNGGGSDSIGSLPSTHQNNTREQAGDPASHPGLDQFALVLVGNEDQVRALIKGVSIESHVEVVRLGDAYGTVRVRLKGVAHLELDRNLLARSFVSVSLDLGSSFDGGVGLLKVGIRSAPQVLHVGSFDLHLAALDNAGLLDAGGLTLKAKSKLGTTSGLHVGATSSTLTLDLRP